MTKVWLSSDLHLGHNNIYTFVGFGGVTRTRAKFLSAAEADEFMLDAHNDLVAPEDHWYCLGDLFFPKSAASMVPKFNGKKRLILGNHDRPDFDYRSLGFQKIYGMHQMAGLWLTHAPIHWGEEHSKDRQGKFIGNVHGHIHDQPSPTPWHFNVSVESIGYAPIELDEVVDIMRARKDRGYVQRPT